MLDLNFHPFPVIETERLILRQVTMADAPAVFMLRSNAEAMRYIGKPLASTLDEARELIKRIEDGIETNTAIGWAITLKSNPQFIGTIGFHIIEKQHQRAEIGYMLLPEFWKRGLMSEAIEPVINFGFASLKFHSIQANIDPNNKASAATLKKFGFVSEAHFKENYFFNGKFMDTEIFSLLNKTQ